MTMMYPLFFQPVYHEKVWGGNRLKDKFNREIPNEHTGESWEIACHDHGMSIVANGEYKGKTLYELMQQYPKELLGTKYEQLDKFPLLVKILDANDKLSIQVHPQDEYAKINENGELGKCEMWYIIDAKPGAKLVVGTKSNVSKEEFRNAIENGACENLIEELEVHNGDVISIPAGMLHAIEDGIMLAEIQQNSDTTYRVYDWNRVGLDGKLRELHVDKAMDVIDFEGRIKKQTVDGLQVKEGNSVKTYYIANKYFAFVKINLNGELIEDTENIKFYLYTCVEGKGIINCSDDKYEFKAGQSFMIPASVGQYKFEGNAILLKSFVPDINNDFIVPLEDNGYDKQSIKDKVDIS